MQLSEWLKLRNKSHADFAIEIGVTPMAVSRYVAGLRFPHKQILPRIAEATGGAVTANDFLYRPSQRVQQSVA